MTDEELKELVAENSREIKELGKQIGYIGNSFGRFTEGLFTPSLDRILLQDFGLDTVGHRVRRRDKDTTMEIDVLGYSNSEKNTAIVVEIKSNLRDDDIKEFKNVLKKFPKVYTEHKDKIILGMMAAVNISSEQKAQLEKHGIYVVKINDDVFRVISEKKFEPKDFGLKS